MLVAGVYALMTRRVLVTSPFPVAVLSEMQNRLGDDVELVLVDSASPMFPLLEPQHVIVEPTTISSDLETVRDIAGRELATDIAEFCNYDAPRNRRERRAEASRARRRK